MGQGREEHHGDCLNEFLAVTIFSNHELLGQPFETEGRPGRLKEKSFTSKHKDSGAGTQFQEKEAQLLKKNLTEMFSEVPANRRFLVGLLGAASWGAGLFLML